MTTSLKKAFAKAADLPDPLQDQLAAQLLEDIKGELEWDRTLASPKSQKLLDKLASAALKAKREGKTVSLGWDEI